MNNKHGDRFYTSVSFFFLFLTFYTLHSNAPFFLMRDVSLSAIAQDLLFSILFLLRIEPAEIGSIVHLVFRTESSKSTGDQVTAS